MIRKALLLLALTLTTFVAPVAAVADAPLPTCYPCDEDIKLPPPPPAPGLPSCYPNCNL
jgi:hypothetical protein